MYLVQFFFSFIWKVERDRGKQKDKKEKALTSCLHSPHFRDGLGLTQQETGARISVEVSHVGGREVCKSLSHICHYPGCISAGRQNWKWSLHLNPDILIWDTGISSSVLTFESHAGPTSLNWTGSYREENIRKASGRKDHCIHIWFWV